MITVHEIARADLSMSTPVYTLLTMGWSYMINRYGTEELKQEILPLAAQGKTFVGINNHRAGGGSDLGAIKTTAIWNEAKQVFLLNGEKAYVSGPKECAKLGPPSGHCTLVKTDPDSGHKGMTFIWVPAHLDGIQWTVYDDMGRMGLSTGGWIYKDVELPRKNILGEEGKGFYAVMDGFNTAACWWRPPVWAAPRRRSRSAASTPRSAPRSASRSARTRASRSRWPTTG